MGFLNPTDDDDYRISAMPGTTEVPAPGALEGALSSIPKGVAAGTAKMSTLSRDIAQTDFGQGIMNLFPLGKGIQELLSPEDKAQVTAATKVAAEWGATGQDPRKTGVVGRTVAGTAEGLTIATAGAAAGGPWGAAALLGSTEGYSSYNEARAAGLDHEAAKQQALLTGGFSAASAFIPMKFGSTLAQSVAGGAASNVGLGMLQRGLTSKVLEENGYSDMAKQYRVFDGEAMLADSILGAAFGGMGHAMGSQAPKKVTADQVDAAAAVAAEEHFNRSGMGIPTDPQVATMHADTMQAAMRALAEGDEPNIPRETAQKLADNVLPDPIHEVAPMLHEAAKEDLPGYEAAAADVPRVELPPEKVPEPKPEVAPAAAGETKPANVPLDDYHAEQLDHLVMNYGDMPYVTEDGRETTIAKMADELQRQRNDGDKFSTLHEIAAACAARNGF